ncbi:hypothetical protein RhiJN_19722 [Ceratobasidium sp. AG-Ba]|nr:hypothetical protein RhiJN_04892 [Ceratobasidium sp. AG-Ba]QRV91704.1 hypothetical protein RhiJN_19722 [Ceratobasidium sp. AG-Ba]
MPPSGILMMRAAQHRLAFSSQISTASGSLTHTIKRCPHCLAIIPIGGSLKKHIAAVIECREDEENAIRAGRQKRESERERERQREREQEQRRELEEWRERERKRREGGQRKRARATLRRSQSAVASSSESETRSELAIKRCRVTVEEVMDEDAPHIDISATRSTQGPSTPPVFSPSSGGLHPTTERHRMTVEEGMDRDASQINSLAESSTPSLTTPSTPDPSSVDLGPRAEHSGGAPPEHGPSALNRARGPALRSLRRPKRRLRRWRGLLVEDFPDPLAGAPISNERIPEPDLEAYVNATGTMANPKDFEVAELLMTSGMTDETKDRHLKSILYRGNTPWPTGSVLLADVDKLPHGPEFFLDEIEAEHARRPRIQYMVRRNALELLQDLFANRTFGPEFAYAPVKYWTTGRKRERVWSCMRSAAWWWEEQEKLQKAGKGAATIAPIILATDETHLSVMSGGQTAYPVYMALGNLIKDWRRKPSKRGMVLLGFLPTDSFEDIDDDDERRRLKADLVHRCMEKMMEPLKEVWEDGVEMWCPDGRLRRVFPRMAAYMADWPEQNLQCCTTTGTCPICSTKGKGRGDLSQTADLRDRDETLGALRAYFICNHVGELKMLGLKPVWPWWGDLPDVDLHKNIAPDILHQLYQGVFKSHLFRWMKFFVGEGVLDDRFAAMPRAEGMMHFPKGVSAVKQWTGRESKEMLKQILPAVLGNLSPEEAQLARSVVDFIFIAHSASMTDTDLATLEHELDTFHRFKDVLIARGFYQSSARFDRIPKLHALSHYVEMIRWLGTPDGYSTEASEHLHIEFAKIPWRASNKVRPLPQMLTYIQRQEAIRIHRTYLDRLNERDREHKGEGEAQEPTVEVRSISIAVGYRPQGEGFVDAEFEGQVEGEVEEGDSDDIEEGVEDEWCAIEPVTYPDPHRHLAINPTKHDLRLKDVSRKYEAPMLECAIKNFLIRRCNVPVYDVMLSPEHRIPVWHCLYLHHRPLPFAPFESPRRDVVRASAPILGPGGRVLKEGVWDTALYLERPNQIRSNAEDREKHGIQRYRAGRVRSIFSLPGHIRHVYPGQLAYVEVFRPFEAIPASPYGRMHSTAPELDARGRRRVLVIPVNKIVLACHLVPKFNQLEPDLRLDPYTDLLSIGRHFWFNHYYNHYLFLLIQHWRRRRPTWSERLLALRR